MRALLLLAAGMAGCTAASSDRGLGAALYVEGGQFRPGAFPAATGGPAALSLQSLYPTMVLGEDRQQLTAALDPAAHAAILGVGGEPGTWIVLAGPPDLDTPGQATVHATVGVDHVDPGMLTFELAAVDAQGRIGEPATLDVVAADAPPPDGDLVVTLQWLGAADLDLHVVDPLGGEAWSGSPNTWQKPGPGQPPADPNAYLTGGILDQDGNAGCTRDGAPHEDVVWKTRTSSSGMMVAPIIPSGDYTVRVDARNLCGDASAGWSVDVLSHGERLSHAQGIATPSDATYEPHGAGAGITALHFQL